MSMFDDLKVIKSNLFINEVKMLDIDELHDSEDNIFDMVNIDEFAETILGQGGVKENLIVKPLEDSDNSYEIISGHRRAAAVRFLLEREENVSRLLPCLVAEYKDDDDKKLDIILMNISARVISDAEMWRSYEVLSEVLERKKENGEKFGRTRERLAELMQVSPSQMSKLQAIDRNAVSPVKKAIDNGDLSISTAYEISKLNDDKQEEIIENTPIEDIKRGEIKKKIKENKVATSGNFTEQETSEPLTADGAAETNFSFSEQKEPITETTRADDYNRDSQGRFASVNISLNGKVIKSLKEKETVAINILSTYRDMTNNTEEIEVAQLIEQLLQDILK